MKEATTLVAFLVLLLSSIGGFSIFTAIGATWKPEHTNAIVYGLISLAGLGLFVGFGLIALIVVAGAVWVGSRRGALPMMPLLSRPGPSPELVDEQRRWQIEGARARLFDRLIPAQPTAVIDTHPAGHFVDLVPGDD